QTFIPPSSNPGTFVSDDGRTINYKGLDPYSPLSGDASHVVITGSAFNDNIVVEDANPGANDGKLRVTVGSNSHTIGPLLPSGVPGDPHAVPPSLTIIGGAGGDTITVNSFHPLLPTDLLIYGDEPGQPAPEPDTAHDVVEFKGDVYTHGGH